MNRNMPGLRGALKLPENRPAIHNRQLDIKDNGVRQIRCGHIQTHVTLEGHQTFEAPAPGHIKQNLGELLIIFNNQKNLILG
ncbi:hypothetical protein D3C75_738160 [compost metagenome]